MGPPGLRGPAGPTLVDRGFPRDEFPSIPFGDRTALEALGIPVEKLSHRLQDSLAQVTYDLEAEFRSFQGTKAEHDAHGKLEEAASRRDTTADFRFF